MTFVSSGGLATLVISARAGADYTFQRVKEVIMAKTVTLDVRQMPPWERHPKIFELFDGLAPGDTLLLINDHDPRPLHYQFMNERTGKFEWHSQEKGPQHWEATIKKVA